MSVIVCFGDSNTWGYDPAGGARFAPDVRWTGVLRRELGPEHTIIEEGLGGRTTVFEDPIMPGRRGSAYLAPCMLSHAPFDLLIIALGCNDMKARFGLPLSDLAEGLERLIEIARAQPVSPTGDPPALLVVAPPPLARLSGFAETFGGATEKSQALAARYAEVAERCGAGFVDSGQFIHCSDLDGIHFDADQHAVLGRVMAEAVKMVFAA